MTLYGFFFTDCIYESAHGLVSLHQTKAGAYRAMVRNQFESWEERHHDRHGGDVRGMGRREILDRREDRSMQSYKVRPVEVVP